MPAAGPRHVRHAALCSKVLQKIAYRSSFQTGKQLRQACHWPDKVVCPRQAGKSAAPGLCPARKTAWENRSKACARTVRALVRTALNRHWPSAACFCARRPFPKSWPKSRPESLLPAGAWVWRQRPARALATAVRECPVAQGRRCGKNCRKTCSTWQVFHAPNPCGLAARDRDTTGRRPWWQKSWAVASATTRAGQWQGPRRPTGARWLAGMDGRSFSRCQATLGPHRGDAVANAALCQCMFLRNPAIEKAPQPPCRATLSAGVCRVATQRPFCLREKTRK